MISVPQMPEPRLPGQVWLSLFSPSEIARKSLKYILESPVMRYRSIYIRARHRKNELMLRRGIQQLPG